MTLTIIGGAGFVIAMIYFIAADNRLADARQRERHAAEDLRRVRELAALLGIAVIPDPATDDGADGQSGLDPVAEEPPAPSGYRGRRRRTWRITIAGIRASARAPFDIADGWDDAVELPRPITPDLAAAGAVEAEGLDAELAALTERELTPV